jgi:hypothetical protein
MNTRVAEIDFTLACAAFGNGTCRRRLLRTLPIQSIYYVVAAWVLGLASFVWSENCASAQEPVAAPVAPVAYPLPIRSTPRPFHLCDFFLPNDGIPRTYSYYYTPWLNQPRHIPFIGPDGRKYWRTTVRGLPMGMQWAAP